MFPQQDHSNRLPGLARFNAAGGYIDPTAGRIVALPIDESGLDVRAIFGGEVFEVSVASSKLPDRSRSPTQRTDGSSPSATSVLLSDGGNGIDSWR